MAVWNEIAYLDFSSSQTWNLGRRRRTSRRCGWRWGMMSRSWASEYEVWKSIGGPKNITEQDLWRNMGNNCKIWNTNGLKKSYAILRDLARIFGHLTRIFGFLTRSYAAFFWTKYCFSTTSSMLQENIRKVKMLVRSHGIPGRKVTTQTLQVSQTNLSRTPVKRSFSETDLFGKCIEGVEVANTTYTSQVANSAKGR